MAITTLSMVLTVFVLNLHHITDRPVPHILRRIMLIYIARMLGMCGGDPSEVDRDKKIKYVNTSSRNYSPIFRRITETPTVVPHDRSTFIEIQNRNWSRKVMDDDSKEPINGVDNKSETKKEVKETKEASSDEMAKDWKRLAEVFDRLFFWLFLIAIFVSTLVLFHPLTQRYWEQTGNHGNTL